jgi:hypothetical protein
MPERPVLVSWAAHTIICLAYAKKASPKHKTLVDEFVKRLNEVLPWDQAAVDATQEVKSQLTKAGLVIGENDTAIAGHAIASGGGWSQTMCVNLAAFLVCLTKIGFTKLTREAERWQQFWKGLKISQTLPGKLPRLSAGGDNGHENWFNFMRSPTPLMIATHTMSFRLYLSNVYYLIVLRLMCFRL